MKFYVIKGSQVQSAKSRDIYRRRRRKKERTKEGSSFIFSCSFSQVASNRGIALFPHFLWRSDVFVAVVAVIRLSTVHTYTCASVANVCTKNGCQKIDHLPKKLHVAHIPSTYVALELIRNRMNQKVKQKIHFKNSTRSTTHLLLNCATETPFYKSITIQRLRP